jgi:hypothetical protein
MNQAHAILFAVLMACCGQVIAQTETAKPPELPQDLAPSQVTVSQPLHSAPNQHVVVSTQPPAVQQVQVRVLSTTPVQVSTAQGVELSYKTVYELSGQQYVVQLPQDPGDYLTLQLPMPAVPMAASASGSLVQVQTVVAVPYAVYPSVFFVGSLYRPLPYIGSIHHHPAGGGRFGRRGGRH